MLAIALRVGSLAAGLAVLVCKPLAAQTVMEFERLPKEVRDLAVEVRSECRESDPKREAMKFEDKGMQGITILALGGDGKQGIIVDNAGLCGERPSAGFGCSNRGCDLTVFKELSKGHWQQIFREHLYDRYLVIDWERMRLQMMIASIYAGDSRCQPDPRKNYSSGMSCNLIVTYRNSRWNWQIIR